MMNQLITHSNLNDGFTSRAYTGYPLNSTLVSSYTPDTIRSIITQAAAGQPYSTSVWIRINRAGIQITAQDSELARTRVPVFIPIGLTHDIYMLPSINNVICIIYDEQRSNMKGILLYVIYPADAQLLREDFRLVKQASTNQQQPPPPPPPPPQTTTFDTHYPNIVDTYRSGNNQMYTPLSATMRSPLLNNSHRHSRSNRHRSPRRPVHARDNELYLNPNLTLALPEPRYTPHRSDYQGGREDGHHRRHRSSGGNRPRTSSSKRSSDGGIQQKISERSGSGERSFNQKSPANSSQELTEEQMQQQQLILQQQQMLARQAAQQMPLVPIGIYNRYVPKAIPLPSGETLKTTLPSGMNGEFMNGTAVAYIEPQQLAGVSDTIRSPVISVQQQEQNGSFNASMPPPIPPAHHRRHHHRRHHIADTTYESPRIDPNLYIDDPQPPRSHSKTTSSRNHEDTETKQYLKLLVDEMQAMKLEMNRLRQSSIGTQRARTDSIHADLKEIRSHIDFIQARMITSPKFHDN